MNKRVLLVGGGHAHLHVVTAADDFRDAGLSLELIDPGKLWYSGMATGMLSGYYSIIQDTIDLDALCKYYRIPFHRSKAVALDAKNQRVGLESGEELGYDALSLDVGSQTNTRFIEDPAGLAWTVKPISGLIKLQAALKDSTERPLRVAVVGGGPTGCEIAANVDALCNSKNIERELFLFQGGERILANFPEGAAKVLERRLKAQGIRLVTDCRVSSIRKEGDAKLLVTERGATYLFNEIILAAGLIPSESVSQLGLGEEGMQTSETLEAISFPSIFGAGDCIAFCDRNLPKVGVFGVRQAPILKHNLIATLQKSPLKSYKPQKNFLIVLNLGNGEGLAVRGEWYWMGKLAFIVKNFIDTCFMKSYQK